MSISAINLGNSFSNSNGTTVLGGLSSGINTNSIITAAVSGQQTQVTTLQSHITTNNGQLSALSTLSQLLTSIQNDTLQLSQPQSLDPAVNVFAQMSAQVSSNTTLPASNFFTVSTSSTAAAGTYTISNISQIATATTQESNSFSLANANTSVVAGTPTAGMFSAGTITFKSGATITLTAGETLNQVATAFNAVTSGTNGTGITATVVQTASGSPNNTYKLVFTGANTGTANGFNLSAPYGGANTITSDPSGALTNITFTTDQAAQDALFKFNGVSIDRASNTVSDLVSGVTFNLLQNTSGQTNPTFSISVAPNTTAIQNAISSFVNDYNAFLSFYAQQTQVDPTTGAPASTAVLNNDTTLRSIYSQLTNYTSSVISGLSGSVSSLSSIGINFGTTAATSTTPTVYNTLSINSSTLANAINTNLKGVEGIFGYMPTTSTTNLGVYSGPINRTITNFTINATQSTSTYTAQYSNAQGVLQTVNLTATSLGSGGLSLTAPSNSALAGLVVIYTGAGDQTGMTVTATNGIAYLMNALAITATTPGTGLIATGQQAIQTKNTTTQNQINTINTQINNTKTTLLQKFNALETALTAANSSLNYLNAQQLANSSGG